MGQKVNPICLRLGYIENWRSLWYAEGQEYQNNIIEDYKIRQFIKKRYVCLLSWQISMTFLEETSTRQSKAANFLSFSAKIFSSVSIVGISSLT